MVTLTTPDVSYLSDLQQLCESNPTELEWLLICHNDELVVDKVSKVMGEQSAALLQICQTKWDAHRHELYEAVAWAIEHAKVKHILLLGHSDALLPEECTGWMGSTIAAANESRSERTPKQLLENARLQQQRMNEAKEHYAKQVYQICQDEVVGNALSRGQLQLHGLFYVAPSGVFLKLDLASEQFEPISPF